MVAEYRLSAGEIAARFLAAPLVQPWVERRLSTDHFSVDGFDGNDEMDQVNSTGDAELQPDGSLHGTIHLHNGDDAILIDRKWTSSTAS